MQGKQACLKNEESYLTFHPKEDRSNYMAVEEHRLNFGLWPDRVDDTGNRVMEDEHEHSAAKYVCYMLDLLTNVEDWRCIDSVFA